MQALSRNKHLEGLPSFCIQHRPGKLNAASDVLSRREQDIPVDAEDERLKNRELQLLKEGEALTPTVHPIHLTFVLCRANQKELQNKKEPEGPENMERIIGLPTHSAPVKIEHEEIFENEDLQLL